MSDIANIVNYLRSNLSDPESRGYPTTEGLHWIYIDKPTFSFSVVGYPIIFVRYPNTVTMRKTLGSYVNREEIMIEVFTTKSSQVDTLLEDIKHLLYNATQSDLPGMYNLKIISTTYVPNLIDGISVHQLMIHISYNIFER